MSTFPFLYNFMSIHLAFIFALYFHIFQFFFDINHPCTRSLTLSLTLLLATSFFPSWLSRSVQIKSYINVCHQFQNIQCPCKIPLCKLFPDAHSLCRRCCPPIIALYDGKMYPADVYVPHRYTQFIQFTSEHFNRIFTLHFIWSPPPPPASRQKEEEEITWMQPANKTTVSCLKFKFPLWIQRR